MGRGQSEDASGQSVGLGTDSPGRHPQATLLSGQMLQVREKNIKVFVLWAFCSLADGQLSFHRNELPARL